jgi:hypothetical protein
MPTVLSGVYKKTDNTNKKIRAIDFNWTAIHYDDLNDAYNIIVRCTEDSGEVYCPFALDEFNFAYTKFDFNKLKDYYIRNGNESVSFRLTADEFNSFKTTRVLTVSKHNESPPIILPGTWIFQGGGKTRHRKGKRNNKRTKKSRRKNRRTRK